MTFYVKQNDTAPPLQVQLLEDDNATPISLTTAASVVFNMRNAAGAVLVSRGACTIVNAANGIVEYPWRIGDTSVVTSDPLAPNQAEFEIIYTGGGVRTVPSDGYIYVVITDDIA